MINIFSLLLSLLNNAYFISYIKSKTFDLPLTFKEEQFYLQKKCNGDKAARDLLIEKNLRLVAHIAKKYNNNRDLQEDLISIGTIGLIKAIDSYSIDKKTKKINQEVSLNEVIGVDKDGSEVVLEDLIDNKEKPILDQIYDADNLQKLIQCFDVLTSKEKDILIKRYGLNSSKKMTQKEIAKEYHISRSYISRIEKRALIKLLKCYLQEKEG